MNNSDENNNAEKPVHQPSVTKPQGRPLNDSPETGQADDGRDVASSPSHTNATNSDGENGGKVVPPKGDMTIPRRERPDRNTAILPPKDFIRRQLSEAEPLPAYVNKERELILVIRGMVERYKIPHDTVLTLGRADPVTRYQPDVDLTPYGAMDRGVSRSHAKLEIKDDRVYVTDLGSTNGTYVAGVRLERDKPRVVNKGEDLTLGRLGIQILFRN